MIKVIFADLNGTLINTMSGELFPAGIWDIRPNMEVWEKLRVWSLTDQLSAKYLFFITNEGGIEKGFTSNAAFFRKLDFIASSLREFLSYRVTVDFEYYPFNDYGPYRKPNCGMLQAIISRYKGLRQSVKAEHILMIGDASGLPGQFSDSDKRCAANAGISYLDVSEFINFKF